MGGDEVKSINIFKNRNAE